MAKDNKDNAGQNHQSEIDMRKKIEQKLKQRLAFEKTVSAISSRFVGVKNIDLAINQTLKDVGRLSGASRAYLFLFSEDMTRMTNTHEWCRKGVSPQKHTLQDAPVTLIPYAMTKLKKGEVIHTPDVSKMSKSAKTEKKLLQSQKIKSLLVVPLYIAGKLAGFAGFDNVAKAEEWGDEDLMILRICSEIVGKALESKKADDKLKESEEKYRILLDNIQDGVFIIIDGKLEYINEAFAKIPGYPAKEIMDRPFGDFVAPEDLSMVGDKYLHLMTEKIVLKDYEFRGIRKGSDKRTTVRMNVGLIDYHGKKAAIGTIKDVTLQKQTEEQISYKNALLEAQSETSIDGILVVDEKGKVLSYNKRFLKMWQIPDNIIKSRSDKKFLSYVMTQLKEPQQFRKLVEYLYSHKNKKSRDTLLFNDGRVFDRYSSPLRSKDNHYHGRVWYFRDITKEKKAEEKIKLYSRKLESQVRKRTKELTKANENLKERVDELERIHKLVIGRELKMVELKKKIKELEKEPRKMNNKQTSTL